MNILRPPKLTTEYTGDLENDFRNLRLEYAQKKAKMMNKFGIALIIIDIIVFTSIVVLIWRLL